MPSDADSVKGGTEPGLGAVTGQVSLYVRLG